MHQIFTFVSFDLSYIGLKKLRLSRNKFDEKKKYFLLIEDSLKT